VAKRLNKPTKGYRSKFENSIAEDLEKKKVDFSYETVKLEYVIEKNYIPDFILPNGIFVEAKGYWPPSDRTKLLAVLEKNPEADVRMVFQANNKIHKASEMRYGDWCDKRNIKWSVGEIPQEWIDESPEE
jgi:hypothetical protein